MSDVIPFPKPSKPKDDETAELLKLLERIQNAAKSRDKDSKGQKA
ncbi:hypothetical protein [Bradyrhizobium sediminis]|nr:hypothetical protein [Bradyrhizobium sediminis]